MEFYGLPIEFPWNFFVRVEYYFLRIIIINQQNTLEILLKFINNIKIRWESRNRDKT